MPRYVVDVTQEWKEFGSVEVVAANEDEAREAARELLSNGDTSIVWMSDMDPGESRVDGVRKKQKVNPKK